MKYLKKLFELNNKNGFTGVDLIIAMGIITIFVPIIMTIYLNTFYTVSATNKESTTTNKAIEIFEKLELLGYDEIMIGTTTINYDTNENRKVYGIDIPKGYYLNLDISKYGDENSLNLIKDVKLEIKYKVGKYESTRDFSRIIERGTLQKINKPVLDNNKVPIRYLESDYWEQISENSNQWYNYDSHIWAISIKKSDITIGENNNMLFSENPTFYVWIPRYAYNPSTGDVKFLYSQTNKTVELEKVTNDESYKVGNINVLKDLPEGYIVHEAFLKNGEELTGIWVQNHSSSNDSMPEVFNILRNSKYGSMEDFNNLFNPFPDN